MKVPTKVTEWMHGQWSPCSREEVIAKQILVLAEEGAWSGSILRDVTSGRGWLRTRRSSQHVRPWFGETAP